MLLTHVLGGNYVTHDVMSVARELVKKILIPYEGPIPGYLIRRYTLRALRNGTWRTLRPEQKALLRIAQRLRVVKSKTLINVLKEVFLQIELKTVRGKALLHGIIIAMKSSIRKLHELLNNIAELLVIGISYLNNPPIYRVYG